MNFAVFGLGLLAGVTLGIFNGRDLAGSVTRAVEHHSRAAVFFGLFKRSILLLGAMFGALYLGIWALGGLAAGYLTGFALAVARRVRSGVC